MKDIKNKTFENIVPAYKGMGKVDLIYHLLKSQKDLKLEERKTNISELMFKRTAEEIVESGFTTGCNDDAIVFTALANYCHLDPVYVEVVDLRWLNAPMEERMIRGHAFVYINIGEKDKVLVDPQRKAIYIDYEWTLNGYKVLGTGKDPHEIGLVDFKSMMELYMDFKEKHQRL